jgi:hypothetical protein
MFLVPLFLTSTVVLCKFLFQMLNGLNGFALDDILLLGEVLDSFLAAFCLLLLLSLLL